jgi:hypothetical protein
MFMKSIFGVCGLLVLFIIGAGGGSAFFWDRALLVYASEKGDIQTVPGEILDYEINRDAGRYGNWDTCEVRVYYSLNEQSFITEIYDLSGKPKPIECENRIKSGDSVTVHYLPSAPGISFVHGDTTKEPVYLFFVFFFGLVVSVIGGAYILFSIIAERGRGRN